LDARLLVLGDAGLLHRCRDQRAGYAHAKDIALGHLPLAIPLGIRRPFRGG
jgi:hypothetical protein